MTTKISITLDDEIVEFIDELGSNRSRTINQLLSKIKQDRLEEDLKAAYIEQNKDLSFGLSLSCGNAPLLMERF